MWRAISINLFLDWTKIKMVPVELSYWTEKSSDHSASTILTIMGLAILTTNPSLALQDLGSRGEILTLLTKEHYLS
jgi:hypothetical protein